MKRILLFAMLMIGFTNFINAQPNFTGQCLRIGRQFGSTSFANAYTTTSRTNYKEYTIYSDKIKNNRWDVNYSRRSKHVYFDAQLDGVVQSLINFAANKDLQNKPLKNMFTRFPIGTGFTSNSSSVALNGTGVDNTLLDFNFCVGAKNIYAGYHLRYYELFTEASYTADNYFVKGHSNYGDKSSSSGLSFHYVRDYLKKIKVHHMLTVDFKNGKKGFDGNVITTQHTVYWGGNQIGLYAAPYLSVRYGGNEGFMQDVYNINHASNPTKSTAIGIKIGVYLTNGDEESKSSGTVNISSGGAGGTSINNTTNTRTNEPTTCTSCNGKGNYTCTRCGGNGRIPDVKGSGSSNCNSCNGKGYHTCIVCNGKGKK